MDEKTLYDIMNQYFADCDEAKRPYTVAGICEILGIEPERFLGYPPRGQFKPIFDEAKRKILRYAEEQLFKSASGVQFFIRSNFGDEKQEKEQTATKIKLVNY